MADTPKATFWQRVWKAAQYTITGADTSWMGPMQPPPPQAPPDVKTRVWDPPVGWNLNYVPRGTEGLSFARLKMMAENCGILRTVIETRKDQVEALEWAIRPREVAKGQRASALEGKESAAIQKITKFLQRPDQRLDWSQWLRELMEQHFVYDAVSIYKRKSRGGDLLELELFDGSMVKPLMDPDGRTPLPPQPAYQAIRKGLPTSNYQAFASGDFIYYPKNTRVDSMYGYPPTAQIVSYVDMTIARVRSQIAYFTEGNIPDGLIIGPDGMTVDQLQSMNDRWNSLFSGNIEERRRGLWVPHGTDWKELKKDPITDQFDEWLARVVCYAFSLPPTPFVKAMNRATANSQQETAEAEGLQPTLKYIKRLMDRVINDDFKRPDLEFQWELDSEFDPLKAATIDNLLVRAGIKTIDEARDRQGLELFGGNANELLFATPTGYVPLDTSIESSQVDLNNKKQQPQIQLAQAKAQATAQAPGKAPAASGQGNATGTKPPQVKKPSTPSLSGSPTPKPTDEDKGTDKGRVQKGMLARPVIIKRPLLNGHELVAWAKKNGFNQTLLPLDMHVTVGFSRAPVDWASINRDDQPSALLIEGGARSIQPLGDAAAVLMFESEELQARWEELIGQGLTWDFPAYLPHVSISYNGPAPDLDEDFEPYDGPLLFGAELFDEIEDNWSNSIVEKDEVGEKSVTVGTGLVAYDQQAVPAAGEEQSTETAQRAAAKESTAPSKRPKSDVDYSKGKPEAHCQICSHFRVSRSDYQDYTCELVQGEVEWDQWCELFETRVEIPEPPDAVKRAEIEKSPVAVKRAEIEKSPEILQRAAPGQSPESEKLVVKTETPARDERFSKIYTVVADLPEAVKDKIKSPKRRRQWMHVFNAIYAESKDEAKAFAGAWATTNAAMGKGFDADQARDDHGK